MDIRKTTKQRVIIEAILQGAMRGRWYDIDELMKIATHTSSKQALQCSLRILEKEGYIKREYRTRRDRKRMIPTLTDKAFSTYRSGHPIPAVSF